MGPSGSRSSWSLFPLATRLLKLGILDLLPILSNLVSLNTLRACAILLGSWGHIAAYSVTELYHLVGRPNLNCAILLYLCFRLRPPC